MRRINKVEICSESWLSAFTSSCVFFSYSLILFQYSALARLESTRKSAKMLMVSGCCRWMWSVSVRSMEMYTRLSSADSDGLNTLPTLCQKPGLSGLRGTWMMVSFETVVTTISSSVFGGL